jgi:hypothetical protein
MPSPVYSTQFLAVKLGTDTLFPVPVGSVAVLRSVTLYNDDSTSPRYGGLYIQATGVWILRATVEARNPVVVSTSRVFDLRVVLKAGDVMVAHGDPLVSLTASGYLFAG